MSHLRPRADRYAFLGDRMWHATQQTHAPSFVPLRTSLKRHANIDVHLGKTRVWNTAGEHATQQTHAPHSSPCAPRSNATLTSMCTWAKREFGTLQASSGLALLRCSLRRRGRRPCGSVTTPCRLNNKASSSSAFKN